MRRDRRGGDHATTARSGSNVVASQSELHARFGGVVPEVASRRHLELVSPVVREALDRAGATLERDRTDRSHPRARADRRAAGRAGRCQGARLGRGPAARPGRSPARSRRVALPPARARRPAVPVPARERRAHAAARRPGPRRVSRARHDARRRCRRGVRQGSPPARARLPRRRRDRPACPRRATPRRSTFPVARVPGLDFSFSGLKTALLYAVRDLDPGELEERRADLAASYQRAIVRALVGRTLEAAEQLGAERVAIVGGVAANSELRASLPDAAAAPLELCTDNAAMIASAARFVEPAADPLRLDAYAVA